MFASRNFCSDPLGQLVRVESDSPRFSPIAWSVIMPSGADNYVFIQLGVEDELDLQMVQGVNFVGSYGDIPLSLEQDT